MIKNFGGKVMTAAETVNTIKGKFDTLATAGTTVATVLSNPV